MRTFIRWVAFAMFLLFAFPVVAQNETPKAESKVLWTTPEVSEVEELQLIHADTMTLTRQKGKPQVFQGAVDIILIGKDKIETRIKARRITVHYDQDLKKVEKIEAEGNVKVTRLDSLATTELAVYRADKNTMELLIDPHVKDSRGELSANKITVFMNTNEVVADGNVRGVVYPGAFEEATAK